MQTETLSTITVSCPFTLNRFGLILIKLYYVT